MAQRLVAKSKTDTHMSFLNAPLVKRAFEEADFLRDRLINLTILFEQSKGQDKELALEYCHCLYALIEKEHQLYTRLRLSNDQEALIAASKLDGARAAAGSDDYINGDAFYRALKEDVKTSLRSLDDTDLDEPVDLS